MHASQVAGHLLLPGVAKPDERRAMEMAGGGGLRASSSSNREDTMSTGICSGGGDGPRCSGNSCTSTAGFNLTHEVCQDVVYL